ncbi:MAG: hypothetical protein ABSB12_00095 [Candidatus Saccharimonadales bacterium]|jgi:hypothetical protein
MLFNPGNRSEHSFGNPQSRVDAQYEPTPQNIEAHEKLTPKEFLGFLNGVANHEAKLLTSAIILNYPNIPFKVRTIRQNLIDLQGEEDGWRNFAPSLGGDYCRNSLAPIGAVVRADIVGKGDQLVEAYKASDKGPLFLPYVGALLDWSLRYPQFSLQEIFGKTQTPGQTRSPQTRFYIYKDLIENPEGISVANLQSGAAGAEYVQDDAITKQVNALLDEGVVTFSSKSSNNNPEVTINDTSYNGTNDLYDTSRENQGIYKFISQCSNGAKIDLESFIEGVLVVDPSLDPVKLRNKLIRGCGRGNAYPNLVMPVESSDFSKVQLVEGYIEAINNLLSRLEECLKGSGDIYKQKMNVILYSPALFANLMKKAKSFSKSVAAHNMGHVVLEEHLSRLVEEAGSMTTEQAMTSLGHEVGRKLSRDAIRTILNELVRKGDLECNLHSVDKTHSRKIKYYYPSIKPNQ